PSPDPGGSTQHQHRKAHTLMVRSFTDLPLTPAMRDAIAGAGFSIPTPIQAEAIGPILEGRDLIGCAQTGTGKTAAFAVPTIERLTGAGPRPSTGVGSGPRALVLAPTRELALQIAETFDTLGGARGLTTVVLIGGEAMGPQLAGLQRRPDVIVATPGRLFDHLERRTATLGSIRIVVLDEADRMLDMGFAPQVERILRVTPLDRQTLCFSATMPPEVDRLVRRHLVRPVRVEVGTVAKPVAKVTQVLYPADGLKKTPLLLRLLGEERGRTEPLAPRPRRHPESPQARGTGAPGAPAARRERGDGEHEILDGTLTRTCRQKRAPTVAAARDSFTRRRAAPLVRRDRRGRWRLDSQAIPPGASVDPA